MPSSKTPLMRDRLCAGEGNCCKKLYLILQLADIRRIAKETGMHPRRFVRLVRLGEFIETDHSEDAVITLKRGQCIMCTRRRRGWCLFFTGRGCEVYPFRPLHCSIYPVNYRYVGGRTLIAHNREKWCRAKFGPLIPADRYIEMADRCDREQKKTQRLVDRWHQLSGGQGTAPEFLDFLADQIGWRPKS